MRLNRVVYVFLIILSGVIVMGYNHPVSYVVFYSFLIMPVITFFLTLFAKRGCKVYQRLDEESVLKNESTTLRITVANLGLMYLPRVRLDFEQFDNEVANITFRGPKSNTVELAPRSNVTIEADIVCKYKGVYSFGISSATIFDPLGLFKFTRKFKGKAANLTVYPLVHEMHDLPLTGLFASETNSVFTAKDEDYSVISDIRKYEPTDSMKKIHWKLSAKKNELMTKNFRTNTMNTILFFIDTNLSSNDKLTALKLEDALCEEIVSMLDFCFKRSYPVELCYIDKDGNFRKTSSLSGFEALYLDIAGISFGTFFDFCSVIDVEISGQKDTSNVFVFSSHLTGVLYEMLRNIKAFGHSLTFVNYYDEKTVQADRYRNSLTEAGISVYEKHFGKK